MSAGRMMEAILNGRTYSIPEIWVAGFCSTKPDGSRYSVMDAVMQWAWQTELAERESTQQEVSDE